MSMNGCVEDTLTPLMDTAHYLGSKQQLSLVNSSQKSITWLFTVSLGLLCASLFPCLLGVVDATHVFPSTRGEPSTSGR